MLTSSASKIFLYLIKHTSRHVFQTLVNLNIQQIKYCCLLKRLYTDVSNCIKNVVYILKVKLLTTTNTKFSILACKCFQNIYVYIGLKLDKPVSNIQKKQQLMKVNCECCHFHAVMYGLSLNSFFQLFHGKKVYALFDNLFSFVFICF